MTFDELYEKAKNNPGVNFELMKAQFIDELKICFDNFPTLKAVAFNGYTPSWNDGDVCTHHDGDPTIFFSDFVYSDRAYDSDNFQDDGDAKSYILGKDVLSADYRLTFKQLEKAYKDEDKLFLDIEDSTLNNKEFDKLELILSKTNYPKVIWDTNYFVLAIIRDGQIELHHKYYEPEY